MNKNIFAGVAISAVMALAASAPVLANNAAYIVDNGGCGMLDQNGDLWIADADHSVVTHSGKGTLKCYASGVPNDTGKAIRFSGFDCYTYAGFTTRSMEVIDTQGNATLTCQVK